MAKTRRPRADRNRIEAQKRKQQEFFATKWIPTKQSGSAINLGA